MEHLDRRVAARGARTAGASGTPRRAVAIAAAAAAVSLVLLGAAPTSASGARAPRSAANVAALHCGSPRYDSNEPSELLPLPANAFRGWTRTYCTDFRGSSLPAGWSKFDGVPKGDPAGRFAPSHVALYDGMLVLSTWRDARYHGDWVSGGVCQCGVARSYGAYFVRSRLSAAGVSDVELLWPKDNSWPPEIDFFESMQRPNLTTFTDHYTKQDHVTQGWLRADLLRWHTWGVVWTPRSIKFVVDWNTVDWTMWGELRQPAQIPTVPMTLDLQQQSWCMIYDACPSKTSSMMVDWVAEFVPDGLLGRHGAAPASSRATRACAPGVPRQLCARNAGRAPVALPLATPTTSQVP